MEKVLLIGIGGMLLFAMGIIVFVLTHQRRVIQYQLHLQKLKENQQKLLLRAAIESEEKERKRMAGELHDEVGASLLTVRLYISQLKKRLPDTGDEIMNSARNLLNEVIGTVRQLSHRLSPELLMKLGLKETLHAMTQKLAASGSFAVSFSASDNLPRLKPERELAVYRIVQEVLNNILKHADASQIDLQLFQKERFLIISLENDGIGFDQPTFEALKNSPGGLGLKNIQSRLNILNANINFEYGKPGKGGTLMTLRVPVGK